MINIIALKALWSTWWRALLGAAIVAGPCLLVGQCQGKRSEAARQDAARALANVDSLKKNAHANDIAANERTTDAILNDKRKEELLNAISQAPPSTPDRASVALGCARLRAQGTDTAAIPECGGR